MKKRLRYPATFFLICIFPFILSSCANPIDQFIAKVDSSDYQEARDIYNEEIYGNLEEEQTVYAELLTRLENAIADYNDGTISDLEARNIISMVDHLSILDTSELDGYTEELNALIASKAAFASAETYYEQHLWYEAYYYYMTVLPNDTNYSSAQEKAASAQRNNIEDLLDLVETSVSEHNYFDALISLDSALNHYPSEQLLTRKNVLISEYEQYFLDLASAAFSDNSNYQDAYDIMLQLQSEFDLLELDLSEEAVQQLDYYHSFYPVELLNLDSYTRSGLEPSEWTSTDKDNLGNTYTYGWKFSWWTESESEQSYLLSGNYDRLTGAFVCHYDSRNVRSQAGNIDMFHSELYIYGDGQLLYSCPNMGYRVDPASFDIDISGVQELTIHIDFYSSSMADMQNGLVDVYVQKFPE